MTQLDLEWANYELDLARRRGIELVRRVAAGDPVWALRRAWSWGWRGTGIDWQGIEAGPIRSLLWAAWHSGQAARPARRGSP